MAEPPKKNPCAGSGREPHLVSAELHRNHGPAGWLCVGCGAIEARAYIARGEAVPAGYALALAADERYLGERGVA